MEAYQREVEETREQIYAALRCLPQDSLVHMQAAICVLFSTASSLAKTLPPEVRRPWALYCYEIADELASPE